MIKKQLAQGDVLFSPVPKSALKGAKPVPPTNGRYIFAIGEATGHDHSAVADRCTLSLAEGGLTYLTVKELTEVTHQEHGILVLEPGTYRVDKQQEFDPFAGWRAVKD